MPGEVTKKKKAGGKKPLSGTPEQRALNRQWTEYNLLYLANNPSHSQNILRELDFALLPFTFFTGNSLSAADREIYNSLYSTYSSLSFQDKEKYTNLSRWFRLIQEDDELRGQRVKLPFSRMPLYK